MSDLLPCPFCGSPARDDSGVIECTDPVCGVTQWPEDWNRRTPPPATKAMIEWCKQSRENLPSDVPINPVIDAFIAEWETQ